MSIRSPHPPSTLAVAVALLTVYLVWGSTYLGIAIMIESMPPLLSAARRGAHVVANPTLPRVARPC
jgi:hypothetical protein